MEWLYSLVNIKHAERLDAVVTKNLLLAGINITKTNVHKLAEVKPVLLLDPAKVLRLIVLGQTSQESDRHAVDITRIARLGGVDVSMGIDPDNSNLTTKALAGGLCRTGDCANGNGVIAAQGKDEPALLAVGVDLIGDSFCHAADGLGVLHIAVGRVIFGDKVGVEMDLVVAVELVVELIAKAGEQTRLDEGRRDDIVNVGDSFADTLEHEELAAKRSIKQRFTTPFPT